MAKNVSKLSVLKEKFSSLSCGDSMSFHEFVEQESMQPGFWSWFFENEYTGELSEEHENKFQRFLNMIDKIQNRKKRIKEKDTNLHIKLSTSDKERFQKQANKLGMSLSAYIRKVVSGENIIVKTDYNMVHQIRKIGVNINQIAHKINQEPTGKNIQIGLNDLRKYMESIQEIIDKIEK